MHRSRHEHALNRIRGEGGRFAPGSRKLPSSHDIIGDANNLSMPSNGIGTNSMCLNYFNAITMSNDIYRNRQSMHGCGLVSNGSGTIRLQSAVHSPIQITGNRQLFKCDPYPSDINHAASITGNYNSNINANYSSHTSFPNSQRPLLQKRITVSDAVGKINKQQYRPLFTATTINDINNQCSIHNNGSASSTGFVDIKSRELIYPSPSPPLPPSPTNRLLPSHQQQPCTDSPLLISAQSLATAETVDMNNDGQSAGSSVRLKANINLQQSGRCAINRHMSLTLSPSSSTASTMPVAAVLDGTTSSLTTLKSSSMTYKGHKRNDRRYHHVNNKSSSLTISDAASAINHNNLWSSTTTAADATIESSKMNNMNNSPTFHEL
ncbi:hypothetical protein GJ496_007856 [Pomphorhynchus laevis]|nr:hypothetical protein GJ496_007856 [Pomphorhynchus laevis]